MAYTVDGAFNEFYDNINLSGDHHEIANTRKDAVIQILKNYFTILDVFPIGSIPKKNSIKARC